MKNLILALALFLTPITVFAQPDSMVTIPRSALTQAQLSTVEATQIQEKAKAYGAWVGVGKEVGEAVNSSLSAISDNAAKFADTKVGKLSMGVVVWKVVGSDILGILYAGIIVFVGLPVLIWSYRKHLSSVVLDKEIVVDGKVTERKYRELPYSEMESRSAALILHGLGAVGLLVALSVALFA